MLRLALNLGVIWEVTVGEGGGGRRQQRYWLAITFLQETDGWPR